MAIWTIHAQRQLRQRMNRQLCDNADALGDLVSQMNDILSHTFPNADHIVVLNQLTG